MSAPRGRVFASHTITTKAHIVFSLIVVATIGALLIFPGALAAPLVSDNFNDNSIDTAKWDTNLFSGFTNTSVPLAETSLQLEIGPLLDSFTGSAYRGIRTVNTYNFSGAYSFVELVKAPESTTTGYAMFTIGNNVDNYYRLYVSNGNLVGEKKIAGSKSDLFTIPYNLTNHRFLRIRHDSGSAYFDTATGSSGAPVTWTQRYTETWNSSISLSSIIFELKGGTSVSQGGNAPGKVIFDNFEAATNSAPAPTVTAISPTSGSTSGGTSVTITGTGFSSGATVSLGGAAATNVMVVSPTSITATTSARTAGTVDVVVTNTDTLNGTLSSGYTYTASAPTVTAISPTSGSTSGGTSVTITGTGFSSGATVSLGGAAATNVMVVSPTSITATTSARGAGTVDVMVTNPDSLNGTLSSGYTYSSPDPGAPAYVRLITANVHRGVGTDGVMDHRRQVQILTHDTDIVCLQEQSTTDTGLNAEMTAAGFQQKVYRENDPSQQDGSSIWIRSSTVTFHQDWQDDLSQNAVGWNGSTNVDKAVVAVKVSVAGRQFYVVNTHLCWSACADAQGSHSSVTRVNQINTLLNWINTNLTGGLDVLIVGDMNFGPAYPKDPNTAPTGINTQRGIFLADYEDLWEKGVNTGKATALWLDRARDGALDMPLTVFDSGGNNTRTLDTRRIDYFFLKKTASALSLHNIDMPDLRAGCGALGLPPTGTPDDLGIRPSDHNWIKLTLRVN
ncbi:MAG TPA: IPT/TIG domain-containing protein [Pyrinomonadaceae bacterium]|nr:IPT/TIG domain-containing protein [Pyrinomonadaceae bacterium]